MTDSLPDNDTPGTERPQVSAVPTPGAQGPAPATARAETAETNEAIEASEATRFEDVVSGRYDADATPSTGHRTLAEHYARVLQGQERVELGDHAVF